MNTDPPFDSDDEHTATAAELSFAERQRVLDALRVRDYPTAEQANVHITAALQEFAGTVTPSKSRRTARFLQVGAAAAAIAVVVGFAIRFNSSSPDSNSAARETAGEVASSTTSGAPVSPVEASADKVDTSKRASAEADAGPNAQTTTAANAADTAAGEAPPQSRIPDAPESAQAAVVNAADLGSFGNFAQLSKALDNWITVGSADTAPSLTQSESFSVANSCVFTASEVPVRTARVANEPVVILRVGESGSGTHTWVAVRLVDCERTPLSVP